MVSSLVKSLVWQREICGDHEGGLTKDTRPGYVKIAIEHGHCNSEFSHE